MCSGSSVLYSIADRCPGNKFISIHLEIVRDFLRGHHQTVLNFKWCLSNVYPLLLYFISTSSNRDQKHGSFILESTIQICKHPLNQSWLSELRAKSHFLPTGRIEVHKLYKVQMVFRNPSQKVSICPFSDLLQ